MFGKLVIFYFVRISRSNLIGHVNRMDSKKIVKRYSCPCINQQSTQ